MRKAKRQMEKAERRAARNYEKAKAAGGGTSGQPHQGYDPHSSQRLPAAEKTPRLTAPLDQRLEVDGRDGMRPLASAKNRSVNYVGNLGDLAPGA